MDRQHFATLYKTLTTDKLLDIIDNPEQYQALAIETAKVELSERKLTAQQLQEAKEIQSIRLHHDVSQRQEHLIDEKVKLITTSLLDFLTPFHKEAPSVDKLIKAISILLGGILIYRLVMEFDLLTSVVAGEWDLSVFVYVLPFILLPTACIWLWLRKKTGWILATSYFIYQAAGALQLFLTGLSSNQNSLGVIDALFPTTTPIVDFTTFVVCGALVWTLCKGNFRSVYQIDKRTMFIVAGSALGFVVVLSLLY